MVLLTTLLMSSRIASERSDFNSLYFDIALEAVLQLCPYNTGVPLGLKR